MNLRTLTIIASVVLFIGQTNAYAQNTTDKQGRKQGHWTKTAKNGKKIYDGQFKDNNPVDTFYYYDSKGKVSLKNYFSNNGKNNYAWLYHSNGNLKAEGNYIDKKKDGKWLYYNEKGKRVTEVYFKNNQKEGQEKVWDDSGKEVIQVATYKAGKREGEFFKSLYSAGYYTCTYKNDKMNGVYTEYYPTKKVKVKGQYKDNNKEGQWIVYNSFEQTVQKLTYKNDKLVEDILILKTMDKDMEVSQNDIAMVRPTGKQTQVITTKGNKIACMQDIEGILEYLNGEKFYRMDEKAKIYVNIDVMRGLDANGVLKTSVDLGVKITPDKDGVEIVKTLFRED